MKMGHKKTRKLSISYEAVRVITNNRAQAILEYVLALVIVFSVAAIIMAGVRNIRDKTWKQIICKVSAMCPDCKAPESVNKILPDQGNCK